MLVTPFEHAARAVVRARTGPGLLEYRVRYLRPGGVFYTPRVQDSLYRTRLCSRYSRAAVSWMVQAADSSARPHSAAADLV